MEQFKKKFDGTGIIKHDEPLATYTTWRVGGKAKLLYFPYTNQSLITAVRFLQSEGMAYKIIGKGSNVLVSDHGYEGVMICLTKIKDSLAQMSEHRFVVGAGVGLPWLSRKLATLGYTGHEFLSGIPGTVGGAIVMNAGTPEGEVRDVLVQATLIDTDGKLQLYSNKELVFDYRTSLLKAQRHLIVLDADFYFAKEQTPSYSLMKIKAAKKQRMAKQPLTMPSCGSVFRNPLGHFAAQLIESCGLKGYSIGGAEISLQHANFIVNVGNATAQNMYDLIVYVKQCVAQKHHIMLETEVEYVGKFIKE